MSKVIRYKRPSAVPFTKEGYEKLKIRRDELLPKREIVLVALQRAREMGDLSENGAYTAAKFELGNVDRELKQLEYNIKYGTIVTSAGGSVVDFGSVVTVELGGKEYTYTLVGSQESDPKNGILSLESPIGIALKGKKVGDVATVVMPDREIKYKILKLE